MPNRTFIAGVGQTKFDKPRNARDYDELGREAATKALIDAVRLRSRLCSSARSLICITHRASPTTMYSRPLSATATATRPVRALMGERARLTPHGRWTARIVWPRHDGNSHNQRHKQVRRSSRRKSLADLFTAARLAPAPSISPVRWSRLASPTACSPSASKRSA